MKFTPEKKIREKNISFYNASNKGYVNQKTSNISTTISGINITKNISKIDQKKLISPLDFIKQKKKFNIQNIFDSNGSKNFLDSKNEALKKIELTDEVINVKKNENQNIPSIFSSAIEKKNFNMNIEEEKNYCKKINNTSFICKDNNINIKINNSNFKKQFKESKYKKKPTRNKNITENQKEVDIDNNNILIFDELNNDSKNSNFIYKFILDNANESEDKFHKKLEKALKKVETQKRKSKKENIFKSKPIKNLNKDRDEIMRSYSVKNNKKKGNIFIFSENAKNKMIEHIDMSSIGGSSKNIQNIDSNNGKNQNKKNNKFLGNEFKEMPNNIKSSLISFLNELI